MVGKRNVQTRSSLRSDTAGRWTVRLVLLVVLGFGTAAIHSAEAQTGTLRGTVSVSSANGQSENLTGASLKLTAATPSRTPLSTVTSELGEYKFTDLAAGTYTLQVDLDGFKQHSESVNIRAG